MKARALVIILLSVVSFSPSANCATPPTLDLMPLPASMEIGEGVFRVDEGFSVDVTGEGATPRLHGAVKRMLRRLADRSTLFLPNEAFLQLEGGDDSALTIVAGREGKLELGVDESYELVVTEERRSPRGRDRHRCSPRTRDAPAAGHTRRAGA